MKGDYLSGLDGKLQKFENYLSKNESVGKWLAGENVNNNKTNFINIYYI